MELNWIDWAVIIAFLLVSLGIGMGYAKQAEKGVEHFFLGGRNLPWWIAGTSMVATTFAADTPLLVTELVAKNGISGNWLWWNFLIGGMLSTFFFADLWRRANIITDVELVEKRYSGKPAAFLRGFKAVYLGIFMNAVIIAWVNLALGALLKIFFNVPDEQLLGWVGAAMLMVVIYSSLSGLMGVVVTDFIQFIIAMSGCIILAVIVVQSEKIGGISGLKWQLPEWTLHFFPTLDLSNADTANTTAQAFSLGLGSFLAYVGMQWWASWYPGAEPGGGGYIAQRMMSAKNEQHAIKAMLLFQIAHYALRPWPWIVVGLCALVLYPDLPQADKKLGYVLAMKEFLPAGLRGLLLVAFLAAYMSTVSTQLNWGASYIINDLYKRFIRPQASQRQFVAASRLTTFLLMVVSLFITAQMETLSGAFNFMIECGAGLGLVLILRWYWWRVNAWSEITATIAPFVGYSLSHFAWHMEFPASFFLTVSFTTAAWLAVTFLTPPTEWQHLQQFYREVRPQGAWKPIANSLQMPVENKLPALLAKWATGLLLCYSALFGIGKIVLQEWSSALVYTCLFVAAAWLLNWLLKN
ncbi:MAG: sodium:solute symporter family protein [Cytophagales bacterium]|nr:Na+:solute symporter [Bernardetiaceae bacterium]MDW8204261.1 sodium:solute symporter family protein [Cytophagales bacterium]